MWSRVDAVTGFEVSDWWVVIVDCLLGPVFIISQVHMRDIDLLKNDLNDMHKSVESM